MNINPDDPKWTAYVLGELNDAARARVEKELESSAAAREVVEEIRLATALLKDEFAVEGAHGLTAEQRFAVAAAASPFRAQQPIIRWPVAAAALAAGLLITATLSIPWLLRSRSAAPAVYTASNSAPAGQGGQAAISQPEVPPTSAEARIKLTSPTERKKAEVAAPEAFYQQPLADVRQPLPVVADQLQQQGQLNLVLPAGQILQFGNSFVGNKARASESGRFAPSMPPVPPSSVLPDRKDRQRFNTEAYDFISDNPFIRVAQDPLATFSIDVDRAAYANMRRFITMNQLPPKDSVRIEEMINYFPYDYPSPSGARPIAVYAEVAAAPWKPDHRLVRIGIKAREIDISQRPPSNLVMSGTLMIVAKDVKIQVEFNPAQVNAYRLIGYENRALRHQDFNDDRKDAGDMGAGQTVTALFEVVPNGVDLQLPGVDPLKYQQAAPAVRQAKNGEILNLRIRYQEPEGNTSQLMESPVLDRGVGFNNASADFRFAAAVASFGMILRESPQKGQSTIDRVIDIADRSRGSDRNGYRDEFVKLVRKARALKETQ